MYLKSLLCVTSTVSVRQAKVTKALLKVNAITLWNIPILLEEGKSKIIFFWDAVIWKKIHHNFLIINIFLIFQFF